MPNWLLNGESEIPLFISYRRLRNWKKLKKTNINWALDSGGFSELSMFGDFTIDKYAYANDVEKYQAEIGSLDFACIQDWMCEPFITAKTGLSILEHQRKTIESYLFLQSYKPAINWLPILQGFTLTDYINHIGMYMAVGIDLTKFKLVGIGSICRRQHTNEIVNIINVIGSKGIALHGFGIKIKGLNNLKDKLDSADSMAWSYDARRNKPMAGCTHKNCSNCIKYASDWYNNKVAGFLSCTKP